MKHVFCKGINVEKSHLVYKGLILGEICKGINVEDSFDVQGANLGVSLQS